MTKIFYLLVFIWTFHQSSLGQVALIQDEDGFTNVRNLPNSQSKVIHVVKSNRVLWFSEEDYFFKNKEWIWVAIPKNQFSINCDSDYLEGYIHKSRITPLSELKPYKGDEMTFEYFTSPFDISNKIIDKVEGKWIQKINGLIPWGIDGYEPKLQVDKIKISISDKDIEVSQALLLDIFECRNDFKIYKIGETYIAFQNCSDGAGGYELVWIFDKNGIKQRLVGSII